MRRRRLFTLAGLTVAVLAAWVAAPALSLTPHIPEPVDFEQALPAAQRVAAPATASSLRAAAAQPSFITDPGDGPVRWISPPVAAPKRFDVVGLVGDPHPAELRTKRDGEAWTEWHEVDSGDPVWAGDSTGVQLRSRGARPSGTLHYVNVSGNASPPGGVLATVRGAIHTAFVSVAATPLAGAETTTVTIEPEQTPQRLVPRSQWDPSNRCAPRRAASYGKVKAAVVHHTVNTNDYSPDQEQSIVLAICRFHRNGNGWDDIGYNALVSRSGVVYEGRAGGLDRAVIGAHAQGFNGLTTGVASIGDHRTTPIPPEAVDAIETFLAWKLFTVHHHHANEKVKLLSGGGKLNRWRKGRKVRVTRVTFHSRLGNTECPGGAGKSQVKSAIIAGTEQKIQSGSAAPVGGEEGGVGAAP
jgi:N-acetylmuramoyl-L-alanine amidase-like protein